MTLQDIEKLVDYHVDCCRAGYAPNIVDARAELLSAITSVVREGEKQVEIVKRLHRETREELYAKELLVAERDARIAELEAALEEIDGMVEKYKFTGQASPIFRKLGEIAHAALAATAQEGKT